MIIIYSLGVFLDDMSAMYDVLELVREDGGLVLCLGLQPAWYEDKVGTVGFHRDGVTSFDAPIKRYE